MKVVRLRIRRPDDFEYRCGDYIYVNIPDVARFEWHPFTISSAPEDQGLIHIQPDFNLENRLIEVSVQIT